MKSPQEILFDTAKHCFAQGVPAKDGFTQTCFYLQPKTGLKCAVGCHLSDAALQHVVGQVYGITPLLQHLLTQGLKDDYDLVAPNIELLRDLQNVHDMDFTVETTTIQLRDKFNEVATRFNLEPLPNTPEFRFKDR